MNGTVAKAVISIGLLATLCSAGCSTQHDLFRLPDTVVGATMGTALGGHRSAVLGSVTVVGALAMTIERTIVVVVECGGREIEVPVEPSKSPHCEEGAKLLEKQLNGEDF